MTYARVEYQAAPLRQGDRHLTAFRPRLRPRSQRTIALQAAPDAGKLETIQDIGASVRPIEQPPMCPRTEWARANMKFYLGQKVCIGLACCIGDCKARLTGPRFHSGAEPRYTLIESKT